MSWLYWIYCEDSDAIKIGLSSRPLARVEELKHMNAGRITPILFIEGGPRLEARLHKAFQDQNLHHEWFQANFELIDLDKSKTGS